ncbi:putative ABC transport system permease protein [Pedobacter steynii]|uniref:Putative ABC transport system permease protein n=1 Tax=Pedobacter steynii TaxID=430522 RepID=A0A1G9J039_9SPHI|nr:ABC transporter permease [Pedobacter steynii]NQX38100.1 ABC transporter permease [Pedobacter steynii]SDL30820.1 putative ABC transport system permease protein [Pedobacter steynii]
MFKLNLKIAFRNIWKNRSASLINIAGLSLGLAGFILILLYLNFETGYDKWSPKLKNVYKVGVHFRVGAADEWWETMPASFISLIREKSPDVESASITGWGDEVIEHNRQFYYDLNVRQADSTFFRTFPFTYLQGDMNTALNQPKRAVINKKTALLLFGTDQVLGKTIKLGLKKETHTITGVWDNEKNRTHFWADVITPMPMPKDEHWGNFSYNSYIRLKEGVDPDIALPKLTRLFMDAKARWSARNANKVIKTKGLLTIAEAQVIMNEGRSSKVELIYEPVGGVYTGSVFYGKSKTTTMYVLSALAIFLLVIACINFTNLAIAHAGKRAREIGVKKVLGVEKNMLVVQFLFETFLQTTCAFLLGLTLVELLLPYFNSLLGSQLSFFGAGNMLTLLFQVSLVFILVTLCAGLYPAVYFSGFLPAKVLKGNFDRSARGILIRKVLVVSQFVITCTFIICFAVMFSQLKFMRNKDVGLQRAQVLSVRLQTDRIKEMSADKFEQIGQRLKRIEGVKQVTLSSRSPWGNGGSSGDLNYQGQNLMVQDYYVGLDYFETLGIPLKSGRAFSNANFQADTAKVAAVVNESLVKELGIKNPIGTTYERGGENYRIIGVVKDFNDQGFEAAVKPSHFIVSKRWYQYGNLLLSIHAENPQETLKKITEEWAKVEPGFPLRSTWLDESFAKNMKDYQRQGVLMQVFSIATLCIALLGLFALATYNAKVRTREIAVRRVLGASTSGILKLLNKEFVGLVLVANVIAFVIAYILMNKWLNGFAYRIDVPVLLFVLTGFFSLSLTILTVSWQAYKAAMTNPVDALKYE